MSLWLDEGYLRQISFRLERFKQTDTHVYNCRCPYCGDSKKNKKKTRGYFYCLPETNHLSYKCFNGCDAPSSFYSFLKWFDPALHDTYSLDLFKEKGNSTRDPVVKKKKPVETESYLPNLCESLPFVMMLPREHPARKYLEGRKLPQEHLMMFRFAGRFVKWTKQHTDKFKKVKEHPRIVFPWYSESGKFFGYAARSLSELHEPKYINMTLDKNVPSFFGLERIDRAKPIYVVEGQFDSLFIDNCIAVNSSSLGRFHGGIYIPDRDTRNKEIMKIVKDLVEAGKPVVMLPDWLQGKDINDYVKNHNFSKEDLMEVIQEHTYEGLEAVLQFSKWKKINVDVRSYASYNRGKQKE